MIGHLTDNTCPYPGADRRFRRKSAAIILANNFRRNSRTSVTSYESTMRHPGITYLLGQDIAGINLFPFKNGFRVPSSSQASHRSSRRSNSVINKICTFFQTFYEKSKMHLILPIVILVVYSFLGGFIFYSIESPEEQKILLRKKEYVEREEAVILHEVMAIERRFRVFHAFYNTTEARSIEVRKYRPYAMNRLNAAVYWYVLQIYYLNDQEMKKSSVLHPSNPEKIWHSYFSSSFGRIFALKNYTQQLSDRCWEIGAEMNTERVARVKLKQSITEFNTFTGLQHFLTPTWTFWNSMFLAVTTYSTIGYGNITPKSRLGKLAAMVYALIGIPLVLMILHKTGRLFLIGLERFWDAILWCMQFVSCVKNTEKLKPRVSAEERVSGGMPVLLAIGVAFMWMFLCAAIFLKFEQDWDYFKSFYFFFCSLTTIGYGDVTPTNSEDMFIIFGLIIIGLSLVSMCINVIQLKLEELFEDLLLAMLEEYDAQPEGMPAPQVTPKMGFVDLWKMWKKRQHRRAVHPTHRRPTIATPEVFAASTEKLAEDVPRAAAGRLSSVTGASRRPPPTKFSDLNLWKIFPFENRRRELLLHEINSRFHQQSKATQTDFRVYEHHRLLYTREFEELDESSTSAPISHIGVNGAAVNDANSVVSPPNGSGPPTSSSLTNASSAASSWSSSNRTGRLCRLRIAVSSSSDRSSSSPVFGDSTSSSSNARRRFLPSARADRRQTQTSSAACSVQSAPNTSIRYNSFSGVPLGDMYAEGESAASSSGAVAPPGGGSHRRWTFFEVGKTPRGAPRGLAVPYMYTRRNAKTHETTEMRRLIAEIDSRLGECRTLAASCASRNVSRNTSRAPSASPSTATLSRGMPPTRNSQSALKPIADELTDE